ncbi:hypothetical protein [Azospirillum largimobile]
MPARSIGSEVAMTRHNALRSIMEEAAAARSALCENELVIRLDNILSIARAALEEEGEDEMPQPAQSVRRTTCPKKTAANPLD